MSRIVAAVTLTALSLLAGCAGPEIPFDRSSVPNLKTIGVLTPDIPEKPTVRLASDVGQSFGLIGGLIDASMEINRNDKLWAALSQRHFSVREKLTEDLVAGLKSRGYDAKPVSVERSKSGFLKNYPSPAESGADAYLDLSAVGIGYGYIAAGIGSSQPYRPFVWLDCRLVRASDNSVLMQDRIMYNPVGTPDKTVSLSPDPAYQFVTFDTLMGDQDKAAAGIDASLHQTADQIGVLVR